jgi:hemoglobin-like flavoprotein
MDALAPQLHEALDRIDEPVLRRTLEPIAADPQRFGRRFYERLFDRAPAVRALFPHELVGQERKLAETVLVLVGNLSDTRSLTPILRELGERHRRYGAQPAHYQVVGAVLLDVLAEVNGAAFDARARQAWLALYRWTVSAMEPAAV